MPPKIRDLISELERAGFTNRGGRGSHRNFKHPNVVKPVTIPGRSGDDAQPYLVKQVKAAIEESKS
jgi:predicted RNA binding protein YcfA (HicA-like mRNA interferase family)